MDSFVFMISIVGNRDKERRQKVGFVGARIKPRLVLGLLRDWNKTKVLQKKISCQSSVWERNRNSSFSNVFFPLFFFKAFF